MKNYEWQRAKSIEAVALQCQTTAQAMLSLKEPVDEQMAVLIKAGGVDLLDLMKSGLINPKRLVDISQLHELEGINQTAEGGYRIGALTTLAQIAGHNKLAQRYPAFIDAVSSAASPQIRNRATIGGNLLQRPRCWYLRSPAHHCLRKGGGHCFAINGDNRYHAIFANQSCAIVHGSTPAIPLVSYAAELELLDHNGHQRRVALGEFFKLPQVDMHCENSLADGELLCAIYLPATSERLRSVYLEVGEKAAFDWPLAAVSVTLELDAGNRCTHASIVLGGVAPAPWQAVQAESQVRGQIITTESANAAAEAAVEGTTPLSDNAYKIPIVKQLVKRAILSTID